MNTNTHVIPPAGATAQSWEDDDGKIYRLIGREHHIPATPDVALGLSAIQLIDGHIEPDSVLLFINNCELSPGHARELAAELLHCADELDGWRRFHEDDWLALARQLTPAQIAHLRAAERLARQHLNHPDTNTRATAQEVLDGLHADAQFYASRNPEPGIEPDDTNTLRTLLRSADASQFTPDDALALVSLLQRVMDTSGGNGC